MPFAQYPTFRAGMGSIPTSAQGTPQMLPVGGLWSGRPDRDRPRTGPILPVGSVVPDLQTSFMTLEDPVAAILPDFGNLSIWLLGSSEVCEIGSYRHQTKKFGSCRVTDLLVFCVDGDRCVGPCSGVAGSACLGRYERADRNLELTGMGGFARGTSPKPKRLTAERFSLRRRLDASFLLACGLRPFRRHGAILSVVSRWQPSMGGPTALHGADEKGGGGGDE